MPLAQRENQDILAVMDAIDRASDKEIALLKDIHRAVVSRRENAPAEGDRLAKSNAAILKTILSRNARTNDDNGNYKRDLRQRVNDKRTQNYDNDNHIKGSTGRATERLKRNSRNNHQKMPTKRRGRVGNAIYASSEHESSNQYDDNRLHSGVYDERNEISVNRKSHVKQTVKTHKSGDGNHLSSENQQESERRKRGANGRFTSKDKSDSDAQNQQQNESKNLFKKMAAFFSGKTSGAGETATDIAGAAAGGGVLWSAGKEALELSSGISEKVVSLNEWNKNRKSLGKEAPPAPVRLPDVAANDAPANSSPQSAAVKNGGVAVNRSQSAYQASKGGNVVSMVRDQNKTIIGNDKTIIDKLKDIEENTRNAKSGAAGGGVAGKILSALGATKIGKVIGSRILAGLSAVLGGKAVIGLLKRAMGLGGIDGESIGTGGFKGDARETAKGKKGKRGLGKAAKAAAVTAAGAATALGAKAVLTGTDTDVNETKKPGPGKAGEKAAGKGAATAAETAEKAGKGIGIKAIAKGALKALPVIGTAIGAGMDAAAGYSDETGQRETFGVGDGQSVSGRQRAEYTAANVVNMGGLVSGGAGLIASGAGALGFDSLAKSMTFDTSDIAKSLDGGISSVADSFDSGLSSLKDFFSLGSDKQVSATTDGANKTADAIGELAKSLRPGGGTIASGAGVDTIQGVNAPAKNTVGENLNIGGENAGARSFRNNNFGNIRYVGQSDAVIESPNAKGEQAFAKYDSPEEGMRGLANQLSSYGNGTSKAVGYQKLNNVRDIITKFAPAHENNTEQYIASLSKSLGVRDNDRLDLNNPDVMTKMIRQIAVIEGGNPQVTDRFIKTAIGSHDGGKWKGEFNPETLEKINAHRAGKALPAIASTDQRANPERYSAVDKMIDGAKSVAGQSWDKSKDKLASLRDMSDEKLGQLFGNVEGLRVRAPDKGLTLPAGDKLPPGLIAAAQQPDAIGIRPMRAGSTPRITEPRSTIPASQVGIPSVVPAGGIKPAQGPAEAAKDENWLDSTASVLKSVGSASLDALGKAGEGALSSMGVDTENPMKWVTDQAGGGVQSMVSDLVCSAMQNTPLSFLSDTVSGAMGSKSGQLTKEALTSFSTSPPAPVTNLAASGIAPVTQPDKDSRSNSDRQTQLLERIAKAAESKDPKDSRSSGNPNVTSGTAQPAPRRDIPLSLSDASLESLWE